MERLTKKDDFFDYVLPEQNIFGDNQAFEISLGKTEYTCKLHITGEAIKRFGELEDVLEKYGIDNLDEFIKEYSSRNIKLANDNYALEQELAELKHKLKVSERALEIQNKSLEKCEQWLWEDEELLDNYEDAGGSVCHTFYQPIEQFKEQAEAEINKRSNNDE